ncbi:diguanylate cyclase (GGDEF)-like protein [Bradyrhizobium sp. GM6.1]
MANDIITHRDALRHTMGRSAVSVGLTVLLTLSLCFLQFGSNPDALVRVGFVTKSSILISMMISGLLTAALSYRSALTMRELALTRAELQRISGTDQLTGLLNRRGFDQAAESALTKARDANLPTTVLMCDIDRFKAINDQFGHDFGDKVLIAVAQVLCSFAERRQMLVARHGGEEFAVVMTGVSRGTRCPIRRRSAAGLRRRSSRRRRCLDQRDDQHRARPIPWRNGSGQGHAHGRSGALCRQTPRSQSRGPGGRPGLGRGVAPKRTSNGAFPKGTSFLIRSHPPRWYWPVSDASGLVRFWEWPDLSEQFCSALICDACKDPVAGTQVRVQ